MKNFFTLWLIAAQILGLAALCVNAQATAPKAADSQAAQEDTKTEEAAKKMQEKAATFVRAAGNEANTLNLAENRVSFTLDAANLLWNADEKTAREMFQNAMSDVRTLLAETERISQTPDEGEDLSDYSGQMSKIGQGRKIGAIHRLREQLVMSLAKYDAKTAYDFLIETRPAEKSKNQNNGYNYEPPDNETRLELRLAEIVAQNDTSRALEIALKSLSKGLNYQLQGLVENLYRKDSEKGAKLASEIVKKLGTTKLDEDWNANNLALALLRKGAATLEAKNNGKDKNKPLLSEAQMRELAEILIKIGLDTKINGENRYGVFGNIEGAMPILTKYAPGSAAQLQLKIKRANAKIAAVVAAAGDDEDYSQAGKAAAMVKEASVKPEKISEKAQRAEAEKAELEGLTKRTAAPDTKVSVEEVRAAVGKVKNRSQKLLMLTQFAYNLAQSGDLKTAKELLGDAEQLTNPQPKKAAEMLESLALVRAYSRVEPEKAFQILEGIIYELNGVIAGFVKVAQFAVEEMIIENGEIDMTGLPAELLNGRGGGAMIFSGLDEILGNLAKADFERTAALADKFERTEIRLTAKMIVAKAIMPKPKADEKNVSGDNEDAPIERVSY